MKSFKSLMESLAEAWPGTPEYKKKFGTASADGPDGSRHKIDRSAGITRATRKYDTESGESEEPTKSREDAAAAPTKRGRGRPPGKYGSYKKKIKESIEILEALETDEEIEEFVFSLDEESFAELEQYLSEEQIDEEASNPSLKALWKEHGNARYMHHYYDNGEDGRGRYNKTAIKAEEKRLKNIEDHVTKHHGPEVAAAMKKHSNAMLTTWQGDYKDPHGKKKATELRKQHGVKWSGDINEGVDLDEAMSHQAKTTMKHVKGATPGEKKAAKDIKPGIAGYRDRVAMLKSAEARGGLKNEEVDEALKHPKHAVLDKNKNNKLDKEDFQILRGEKKAPMKEEVSEDKVADIAAFITKQSKGEA